MVRRRFIMWSPPPILPVEYQQVEYIQSTGNGSNSGGQYIQPGIFTTGGYFYKYAIDFEPVALQSGEREIFATYGGGITFQNGWSGTSWNYTSSTSATSRPTLAEGSRVKLEASSTTSNSTTRPPFLFGQNEGQSYAHHACSVKMYGCKIWSDTSTSFTNPTLIRDMYPCYRVSDNAAGLYDIVNQVFYPNLSGGTDFVVGPAIIKKL